MLTVKIIDGHGNQNVVQAVSVGANTETGKPHYKTFYCQTPEGAEIEIEGYALVYVMNENGKTVADYIVGAGKTIE